MTLHVPPTHEQTPVRCSRCHSHYVTFLLARDGTTGALEYQPDRCSCGHLEDPKALPPGTLFGEDGEPVKTYHPFNRPN